MWNSHHHNRHDGGNDCYEPDRDRCDDYDRYRDFDHHRHHGGGWRDQDCYDGGFGHGYGHGFYGHEHHHNSFVFCH